MEELKTEVEEKKWPDVNNQLSIDDHLSSIMENIHELDQLFGPMETQPGDEFTACDVTSGFLLDSAMEECCTSAQSKSTTSSVSIDCVEPSCVFSDTTEVISSSDLLGRLMSESGISADEVNDDVQLITPQNKRKLSPTTDTVAKKWQGYSEADADDCSSIYSSCASSPEGTTVLRRKKNNEASKVSRANRKAKHQRLFEREKELEEDNARLRLLATEMTKEAESLRKQLIVKLSAKDCPGHWISSCSLYYSCFKLRNFESN